MSWNQAIYTSGGAALLTECLEGRVLTITRAAGAVGTYTEEELAVATTLTDETMSLGLLDITTVEDTGDGPGKKIGVQITNESLEEALELHQVGIFGVLDDEESTEQLILILQDERGVEVPSEVENPDFELDIYAVVAASNTAQITLKVDSDARASRAYVDSAIAAHNEASDSHAEQITERIESRLATGKHYIIDNDNATSYLYSLEVTNGELVLVYEEANT